MQIFDLIDISNDENKWDAVLLFRSSCCLFLFANIFKHEFTFDPDVLNDVLFIDVTTDIYAKELSAQEDLREQKLVYFEGFVKCLGEALNDIVLKAVNGILLDVLFLFAEVDDVLDSICKVRKYGNGALAEEKLFLVV